MTNHRVTIVTDIAFGDSGKGSITDYYAREHDVTLVVRFCGGAQAGHNVVTIDGKHHTFSQFGSASFVTGTHTHLSRFMLVNPFRMFKEAKILECKGVNDAIYRVTIEEDALVISPYQEAANRIREALRGAERHGSCGHGIGETMSDSIDCPNIVLRAKDLASPKVVLKKLESIRTLKLSQLEEHFDSLAGNDLVKHDIATLLDTTLSTIVVEFYKVFLEHVQIVDCNYLAKLLNENQHVVFEGAQGVLLDEWYGFHPYTTWSTTTNANADTLLSECSYDGEVNKLGLLRAYATRHGAGPFVTEDAELNSLLTDSNNPLNPWQENMRFGHFDFVMARYALDVVGHLDGLVISNLDQLYGQEEWSACFAYRNAVSRGGNRLIDRLARCEAPDLDYQARLTESLFGMTPELTQLFSGPFTKECIAPYLELIESELNVPVVLTSTGPTANDKLLRV